MSTVRRFLVLLDVALIFIWITLAIVVYDRLPDTIPTHFGPSGRADSFAQRSVGSWFALTAIGVSTSLLMLGMAHVTPRWPGLCNMPGKEEMLSLPREQQRPFLEQMAMFMTLLATSVLLLFAAIQYDMWRVSTTDQRGLSMVSWTAMAVSIGGMILAVPIWMLRFKRGVTAAHTDTDASHRRAS